MLCCNKITDAELCEASMFTALASLDNDAVTVYVYLVISYMLSGNEDSRKLSTVERYDLSTNVWSAIASLTTAQHFHGLCVLGGIIFAIGAAAARYIYAVGGYDGRSSTYVSSVTRLELSTGVWCPRWALPEPALASLHLTASSTPSEAY